MIELDVLAPAEFDRRSIEGADVRILEAAVGLTIIRLRVRTEIGGGEFLLVLSEQRRHVVDRRRREARLDVVDHLGAAAEAANAVITPMLQQRVEDLLGMFHRPVQLVADLACHALAQGLAPEVADPGVAKAHEADVAQALAGRLFHDEQGVRPLYLEDELAWPHLRRLRIVIAPAELVVRPGHARPTGKEKILLGGPHQHAFAHDLARAIAEDDVLGLTDVEPGEAVHGDGGKELERVAALHPQLCKRRPVANEERVLPGHALVDPIGVFPGLEGRAELRVGVHVALDRKSGGVRQGALRRRRVHDFRRRAGTPPLTTPLPATTPLTTMRAYSSIMASIIAADGGAPRLVMTELQRPSRASVASLGSRSARNSPALMPSRNRRSIRSW